SSVSYDTATYKYVEFRVKLSASMPSGTSDMGMLWRRATAYRSCTVTGWIADGNFHTYQLDMTDDAGWVVTVNQIRLNHPTGTGVSGTTWEIDYFRLSATPEPATMTLLLLGLPLALRRRRK
ncbi:MAG: PEP-CTERM sorting domain-containing protein, partial [Phycisphaerae bacterium]|nr:PEP-CTERM sorting domain-containing protein [Phycisphaerae bacterium]